MSFVKLDCGILDSSLWSEDPPTCKVFITILAMTRPSGICESTAPGIASRCNLPLDMVRRSLEILESPDRDSRSPEKDGRRIERVDGGYFVINYEKYRVKDHTYLQRKRRQRERESRRDIVTSHARTVTVTQAEADTEQPTPPAPLNGGSPDLRRTLHRRKRAKTQGVDTLDVLGNRQWIDEYNRVFDTKLGFSEGNLKAVQRARDSGFTFDQAKQTFTAVYEQSTPSAVWCAQHNWTLEYLVRPAYTNKQSGKFELSVIEKIANDLASGRNDAGTTEPI